MTQAELYAQSLIEGHSLYLDDEYFAIKTAIADIKHTIEALDKVRYKMGADDEIKYTGMHTMDEIKFNTQALEYLQNKLKNNDLYLSQ